MKDVTAIDWIRKARRVALRFAGKVAAQEHDQDDLDLARVLFADPKVDDRLVASGLVSDERLKLDELSDSFAQWMMEALQDQATEARLVSMRDVIVSRLVAARGKPSERALPEGFHPDRIDPKKLDGRAYPERRAGVLSEVSKKVVERADQRDAGIAAAHLLQRALYVGMSRALLRLADEQNREVPGRLCGHSPVKFGEEKAGKVDARIAAWLRGGRFRSGSEADADD